MSMNVSEFLAFSEHRRIALDLYRNLSDCSEASLAKLNEHSDTIQRAVADLIASYACPMC